MGHDVADGGCWRQKVFRSEEVCSPEDQSVWALITSWRPELSYRSTLFMALFLGSHGNDEILGAFGCIWVPFLGVR